MQDSKERAKQLDEELIAEGLAKRQQSQQHASTSNANGSHNDSSRYRGSSQVEDGRTGQHRDSPDRDRHWERDRKRHHRSSSPDRHRPSKQRRSESPEDRDRYRDCGRDRDRRRDPGRDRKGPSGNKPPPAPLVDKPEKGAVYRGTVSNILDFGCFVELQGFKGRTEGLVHITNLSKTRYALPLPSYVNFGSVSLTAPCIHVVIFVKRVSPPALLQ